MPSRRLFKGLATACRSNKHTYVHTQWHTRARTHSSMFRTPLLCSYLVHTNFNTNVEYSIGLYGQNDRCFSLCNDACTCCCETEDRRHQSAPPDVLSAHWTVHGHSREARRVARVHARALLPMRCGTLRVIALCVRGVLDGPSCPIRAAGIELRLDEIDVDHL
jgi:hypothetical protein